MAWVSGDDRIWLVQQIVRNAPEFGGCRHLGANLFNYFVIRNTQICSSRLQLVFEDAISLAITEYKRDGENPPLKLGGAEIFADQLLQKD